MKQMTIAQPSNRAEQAGRRQKIRRLCVFVHGVDRNLQGMLKDSYSSIDIDIFKSLRWLAPHTIEASRSVFPGCIRYPHLLHLGAQEVK